MLHLVITQADVEDMESHVKVMGNVKLKAGTQRKKAEEQKLKQVDKRKSGTIKRHFSTF